MGSSSQQDPNKRLKEKPALDGDFLSLAPPVANTTPSSSTDPKLKQPIAFPPPDYHELAKIDVPSFRGNYEEQMLHSKDIMRQHYNQFSSQEQHIRQELSPEDDLDLELKL
ncbi:hypothetical protein AQUCO_05500084v1 [Aquilegia coerulea]|uniref:Uncharacterized protein n=1 Tax=Aquilegia coerulea TaxID=218851 RepID=A0A2G5CI79_AQUCA|nr:hypothetical protein AQUCO_05500084v1 [Aquilegia coerulea]